MRVIVCFHRIATSCGCVATVCACASRLHAPSHRTAATCGSYSSARAARRRPRARGCARSHWPGSRASAAGVTWTSRTANAPWAARQSHTSVVDAAGAIYVIGGSGSGDFNDVYASTDGGARAGLGRDVGRTGTRGGTRVGSRVGTQGVLKGTKG